MKNFEIIDQYLQQSAILPKKIRTRIEQSGDFIQLFAFSDINAKLQSAEAWLILGEQKIYIANTSASGQTDIRSFERAEVQAIDCRQGLSSSSLIFFQAPDEPALAVVRYTHRQKRAFANIQFIVEEQINGHELEVQKEAEIAYQESMTKSVQEAQASVASNSTAVVWRLLSYLRPYRRDVVWGTVAAVLLTLMALIPPFVTGYLIDNVLRPFELGKLSLEDAGTIAWKALAIITASYFFREFFAWIRLKKMAMMGEKVAQDLRDEIYGHLQKLSLSYFSKKQTGSIISRVSSDTDRLWDFIAFGIVEVSVSVITLVAIAGVLLYLDWRLGLLMTLPIPLFLWFIYQHGESMQRMFLRAWRKWSSLTDVLSDTIPGMRVVKAFNQEKHENARFQKYNHNVVDEFQNIHRTWSVFWPRLMFSMQMIMVLVWAFALPRILATPTTVSLTAGTLVSFLFYMTMYIQPIEIIGQMARMMNRATSSAHRIFEVLDAQPDLQEAAQAVDLRQIRGEIEFRNVCFSYDGVRQTLKGVSFNIQPGEMIGLVGPSGAGKTTVINLIARFYDATGGQILIDGVDLRSADIGKYRKQVGMVLQDPYLFHGTILENIRYGLPEASLAEVVKAAEAANAHEFIGRLPQAYDTIVGERGHTLSGGERQRISIARAILHNPRILILDEATSAVDTETESKIQNALDRLTAGRTVIAIAHRLSTLKKADRLIVLDDGRLAEIGTHAELYGKEAGIFRNLCLKQQSLQEAFEV